MTAKRYLLVKCILNHWGIVDKTLEGTDQLILIHPNKLTLKEIVNELNEKEQLKYENKKLKMELEECRNNKLFSRRELENENQLLKQALREMLENSGNKYLIDLFDKIFDLNYYEWEKKMNDPLTYDYVEWEEVLKKR